MILKHRRLCNHKSVNWMNLLANPDEHKVTIRGESNLKNVGGLYADFWKTVILSTTHLAYSHQLVLVLLIDIWLVSRNKGSKNAFS